MIRFGVICPSEIALRRFMPALAKRKDFTFTGIAVPACDEFIFGKNVSKAEKASILHNETIKAEVFTDKYGGKIFSGYKSIAESNEIDALYIPLPPALHHKWAKHALINRKHVLLEKPATPELAQTQELIRIAQKHSLALHENYMFVFHNQVEYINTVIKSEELGDIRLYRISFGFPKRSANDFRYIKELGGGALYDAGGYTLKYASVLLGESAKITSANLNYTDNSGVDIYGSATMVNDFGTAVQIAFGMDNNYRCDLEVWGSTGMLTTGRILTAPEGFTPEITIKKGNNEEHVILPSDDTFANSIEFFIDCINSQNTRDNSYNEINRQALLVNDFLSAAHKYSRC